MSYDDNMDPNLLDEYDFEPVDEMNYSEVSSKEASIPVNNSNSQNRLRQKKIFNDAKNADKGYCKITRKIKNRTIQIEYYHTNKNTGATIRNAMTGIYESNNRVGKPDEDLFFKVVMCTGGSTTHTLFCDSPEQFERQFMCEISRPVKEKWFEKSHQARVLRAAN